MTRLGSIATTNYETLDGFAVSQNMPPLESLPLKRFCNFVYWYVTRKGDENEVTKFRAKLWQPPKGEAPDKRSPWAPENEMAAFSALKAATGGAVKQTKVT